jgi:hypothetical protein
MVAGLFELRLGRNCSRWEAVEAEPEDQHSVVMSRFPLQNDIRRDDRLDIAL